MTFQDKLRNRLVDINTQIATLDQNFKVQRTLLMAKADALEKALRFTTTEGGDKLQATLSALDAVGEGLL